MFNLKQTLHRRRFLGSLAAGGAAAIGMTKLAFPSIAVAEPKSPPPGTDDSDFEMWLSKIKGKHRQVFDAPAANTGDEVDVLLLERF